MTADIDPISYMKPWITTMRSGITRALFYILYCWMTCCTSCIVRSLGWVYILYCWMFIFFCTSWILWSSARFGCTYFIVGCSSFLDTHPELLDDHLCVEVLHHVLLDVHLDIFVVQTVLLDVLLDVFCKSCIVGFSSTNCNKTYLKHASSKVTDQLQILLFLAPSGT